MSFIIALDTDARKSLQIVDLLSPERHMLKVGHRLYMERPTLVPVFIHMGFKVFLDLTYSGTPDMVAGACRAAMNLGVAMVSIHTGGGIRTLTTAVNAIASAPNPPLLIGTTVPTNMTEDDIQLFDIKKTICELTLQLAHVAALAGLDGVICSPLDVTMLRNNLTIRMPHVVCPAIRMPGDPSHDHAHCVLPSTAVVWGCNNIVVGRPITEACDPLAALERYETNMRAAKEVRS